MCIIGGVKLPCCHRLAYIADNAIPIRLLFVSLFKESEQQKGGQLTQSIKFRSSQSVFASQDCEEPPPLLPDDMESWFLTVLALHIAGRGHDITVDSGEPETPLHKQGYSSAAPQYASQHHQTQPCRNLTYPPSPAYP